MGSRWNIDNDASMIVSVRFRLFLKFLKLISEATLTTSPPWVSRFISFYESFKNEKEHGQVVLVVHTFVILGAVMSDVKGKMGNGNIIQEKNMLNIPI